MKWIIGCLSMSHIDQQAKLGSILPSINWGELSPVNCVMAWEPFYEWSSIYIYIKAEAVKKLILG